jgi:hypothetical protein
MSSPSRMCVQEEDIKQVVQRRFLITLLNSHDTELLLFTALLVLRIVYKDHFETETEQIIIYFLYVQTFEKYATIVNAVFVKNV